MCTTTQRSLKVNLGHGGKQSSWSVGGVGAVSGWMNDGKQALHGATRVDRLTLAIIEHLRHSGSKVHF